MAVGKVTISSINKLRGYLWDTYVIGFGARKQTNGTFYYVRYRHNGTQVVRSIGRHGPLTPDTARAKALQILGVVAGGIDPFAQVLSGEGNFSDFLFGKRGFSDWTLSKRKLDQRAGIADWHLHDLRRTAATQMGDLGIQPHIIEAALNHLSGHKAGVAGIYNRSKMSDAVREALQRWADHLDAIT